MVSYAQRSRVNIFLGNLTHHMAAILDLYIHFKVIFNGVSRRNILINLIEISHTTGLETNARPLARGELNSVRASGSSDLTSPVGKCFFFFFFFFFFF